MEDLNTNILAVKASIDFCTLVIADPTTPAPEKAEFTKYLGIFTQAQKDNTRKLVANFG